MSKKENQEKVYFKSKILECASMEIVIKMFPKLWIFISHIYEFKIAQISLFICRESDDEYSDDDDMSWKVRRAAAKCLDAIVGSRHDMLNEFYRLVSPALIARFKG